MSTELPARRYPIRLRAAKTKAYEAMKATLKSSKRAPKHHIVLELIEETTETKVETTNNEAKADKLNANEIVETKSSAKQSLKRERDDDEKDDTNIDKQFPKKSKIHANGIASKDAIDHSGQNTLKEKTLSLNVAVEQPPTNDIQSEKEIQDKSPLISSNKALKDKYSFGMLETDDSTDDEEVEKTNRPPPPEWSLEVNRLQSIAHQTEMNVKIINDFFGDVEDMDLQEVFPDIPTKYLSRRPSSFYWASPIQHSVIPKY